MRLFIITDLQCNSLFSPLIALTKPVNNISFLSLHMNSTLLHICPPLYELNYFHVYAYLKHGLFT